MHESLFILSFQLCKEFPAMTPLDIDEKSFDAVIDLFADVRTMQIREKKKENKRGLFSKKKTKKNEQIIRRPAGDSWF